jgi:hypothetical protein
VGARHTGVAGGDRGTRAGRAVAGAGPRTARRALGAAGRGRRHQRALQGAGHPRPHAGGAAAVGSRRTVARRRCSPLDGATELTAARAGPAPHPRPLPPGRRGRPSRDLDPGAGRDRADPARPGAPGRPVRRALRLRGGLGGAGPELSTVRYRHRDGDGAVQARYVVGCDGASSFVRESQGLPFAGRTYSLRPMLADVGLPPDDRRDGLPWPRTDLSGRSVTTALRLRPGRWRLIRLDPTSAADDDEVDEAQVAAWTASVLGPGPFEVLWANRFRIHRRSSPVPLRSDPAGRGRGPRPQPGRRPGHERRHPRRREPGLEAGRGVGRRG